MCIRPGDFSGILMLQTANVRKEFGPAQQYNCTKAILTSTIVDIGPGNLRVHPMNMGGGSEGDSVIINDGRSRCVGNVIGCVIGFVYVCLCVGLCVSAL